MVKTISVTCGNGIRCILYEYEILGLLHVKSYSAMDFLSETIPITHK